MQTILSGFAICLSLSNTQGSQTVSGGREHIMTECRVFNKARYLQNSVFVLSSPSTHLQEMHTFDNTRAYRCCAKVHQGIKIGQMAKYASSCWQHTKFLKKKKMLLDF